jgi:uncharacterized protein (DUF1330 family)
MNQEIKTALVINAIPNMERFEEVIKYFAKLYLIFQNHGATNIQKLRTTKQLLGDEGTMATAVIEFPNSKAITDAFASNDFISLDSAHEKLYKVFDVRICEIH